MISTCIQLSLLHTAAVLQLSCVTPGRSQNSQGALLCPSHPLLMKDFALVNRGGKVSVEKSLC